MGKQVRRVSILLFLSGCCALILQSAWINASRLIWGCSTRASSVGMAVFMGGLGLGGLYFGKKVDRHPRPLTLFALLELLAAIIAASFPFLLPHTMGSNAWFVTALIFTSTFFLGGTFPAAMRAAAESVDSDRRVGGRLYGINTLGGAAGAFLVTFYLIESFGLKRTMILASSLMILTAGFAFWISSRGFTRIGVRRSPFTAPSGSVPFVLFMSGAVGFSFFLMEIVWNRMLTPLLGGSVFTLGLVLAITLVGLGLGGMVYQYWERPVLGLKTLAPVLLAEALAIILPFALGDQIAIWTLLLRPPDGPFRFFFLIVGWTMITTLVVAPTALIAGFQFPLLISLLGRGEERMGVHVGLAFACNTLGAVVGLLAGGLLLLPMFSATVLWKAIPCLLILLAFACRRDLFMVGNAFFLSLFLFSAGPTSAWRHSGIGAGRASLPDASSEAVRNWLAEERRLLVWQKEGVESSVALILSPTQGLSFSTNGKVDGSARGDAPTTVWLGLLGGLLHPEPKSALIVGLGTGATAGWAARVSSIQQVDVVELEPTVLEVARATAQINQDLLENPKARIRFGDARNALQNSQVKYDLIISEPSNPYRAGVASLLTEDFYQIAASRLQPKGMFIQWIQAYETDETTLQILHATLHSVFPYLEAWEPNGQDLILVGSKDPISHRYLRERGLQPPFRDAIRSIWRIINPEEIHFHTVSVDSDMPLNTDDRMVLEYAFARTVGQNVHVRLNQENKFFDSLEEKSMDQMQILTPGEPELLSAKHAWEAGNVALAKNFLSQSIRQFQRNPWPLFRSLNETLSLARSISEKDHESAKEFGHLLRPPFSLYLFNDARVETQAELERLVAPSRELD